jgi:integrase
MTHHAPINPDVALAHPDAPTFATVIEWLRVMPGLSPSRLRDFISALRRLAKILDRPLEEIPADPRWLRPRIRRIVPVAAGVSAKSWTNIVSDARAAMAKCGLVADQELLRRHLSPEWSPLWGLAMAAKDPALTAALGRFVHLVNRLGVAPHEVDDPHIALYREALERNELSKDPEGTARAAMHGWNRAEARFPEWPRHRFTIPCRLNLIVLPLATFPPSFLEELERYLDWLAHPDPLDERARPGPLRPATLQLRRQQLLRFASALVHAGEPAESLTDLASLIEPGRVKHGLQWLLKRHDNKKTPTIDGVAEALRLLARDYVKVDAAAQTAIDGLAQKLEVKRELGLTPKNRARLRQLDEPALQRLLNLPARLMDIAHTKGDQKRAPLWSEDAVAIALLLHCPIRAGNLVRIHVGRNLQRQKGGGVFLVFEKEEVKNRQHIEFELPEDVVALIDCHLARRSPLLCPKETPWLFPLRGGTGPMDQEHLAKKVCATIRREAGLEWNLHLFRHLAAKLWLEAHPGHYEALRRILGHSQLSMTLNAYTGFEAGPATRQLSEIIGSRKAQPK